jgi:ubiquitin-like modifier-activating enzyme ATG7
VHADSESVLGAVPHQLRGQLARFETLKIVGQAYDKCTGCSDRVRDAAWCSLSCRRTCS